MTNDEYKELASKIINELDDIEGQDLTITNIGELFIMRLHYALSMLNEQTPKIEIVKEIKNLDDNIEIQEQTEEDKIYSLPEPKKSQELFISLLIKGLNRVIQNWDNIEIILSNLGIDDPNDFIITAKTTFTITDTNKRFEIECDLVDRLLSVPKSNLALDFLFYAIFEAFRTYIIKACKKISQDDLIEILKDFKYIGAKYADICQDRIIFNNFLCKKIFRDTNIFFDTCDKYGLTKILDDYIYSHTFDEVIEKIVNDENLDLTEDQKPFVVDVIFIIYFFVYKRPENLIKMVFFLMSDKMSTQVQEVMYNSFMSSANNSLIQYEYEWWHKETGQTLNIPFPFSKERFDKNNTTIVDYDLDKLEYNPNLLVNGPETIKGIEYHEPDKAEIEQTNECNTREQIIRALNPYFRIFIETPNVKKGSYFITHYLDSVITLSETIKDSYNAYGFAYILFHSKYFNWNATEFNDTFVSYIMLVFDIRVAGMKSYPESKAKDCAKKILEGKISLQGILDDSTLKLFGW